MGIDGVMYAGPIADAAAFVIGNIVRKKRACGYEEIIKKTDINDTVLQEVVGVRYVISVFFINTAD